MTLVNLKQKTGKGWEDYNYPPDYDEQGLNLRATRLIPISRIVGPPFADRYDIDIGDDEFEELNGTAVEVVKNYSSGLLIVIRGQVHLEAAKKRGQDLIRCLVIGTVKDIKEAAIMRFHHIFSISKPLNLVEKARVVMEIKKLLFDEHGIDSFYGKGGARRGKEAKKLKLVDELSLRIPVKPYIIEDLDRFGNHIGPTGLEGLYRILEAKQKSLRSYKVREANSKLNGKKIRYRIEREIQKMEREGKDHTKIVQAIGIMVYDAIFERKINSKTKIKAREILESLEEEETEPADNNVEGDDTPVSDTSTQNVPSTDNSGDYSEIGKGKVDEIELLHQQFVDHESKVTDFLKTNRSFTAKDSEAFDKMLDISTELYDNFKFAFYKANHPR